MRTIALLSFAAAIVVAAPASAQSFVGEWKATATVQDIEVSEMLVVRKTGTGYSIEATPVEAPPPGTAEAGQPIDIKLDGDNFSFKRALNGGEIAIVYTGVVKGDHFEGTAAIGDFGSVPYRGVRMTPAPVRQ